MGVPKIRGTFWGSQSRIIVFLGLHWGPLILGNYHMGIMQGDYQHSRYIGPGI